MNVAQITGIAVTAIVVFGTDLDTVYAMPLGIFAGALAMFFVAIAEQRQLQKMLARAVSPRRRR
jgi:hypothetical protein